MAIRGGPQIGMSNIITEMWPGTAIPDLREVLGPFGDANNQYEFLIRWQTSDWVGLPPFSIGDWILDDPIYRPTFAMKVIQAPYQEGASYYVRVESRRGKPAEPYGWVRVQGGGFPHPISRYYRGAGYTPASQTGVPAGGQISILQFLGKSRAYSVQFSMGSIVGNSQNSDEELFGGSANNAYPDYVQYHTKRSNYYREFTTTSFPVTMNTPEFRVQLASGYAYWDECEWYGYCFRNYAFDYYTSFGLALYQQPSDTLVWTSLNNSTVYTGGAFASYYVPAGSYYVSSLNTTYRLHFYATYDSRVTRGNYSYGWANDSFTVTITG